MTQEGKAAHWVAESVLATWSPLNDFPVIEARSFLGAIHQETGTVITEEIIEGVGLYLQDVWEVIHVYPRGMMWEAPTAMPNERHNLNGHTDLRWTNENRTKLVLWDFKFGYRPVAAFQNWQLLIYAAGSGALTIPDTELRIVQPRDRRRGQRVKVWSLTPEIVRSNLDYVLSRADLALGPNPPTFAGPHCYKCKAAGQCSTLNAATLGAIDIAGDATPEVLTEQQISHELALIDRAAKILKARADAMESTAIERISSGKIVPGYEMKRSLSNRRWTHKSPAETIAWGMVCGVDLAKPPEPVTPNQAEVSRGLPREVIDLFTHRAEGATVLAPIDPDEARKVFHGK